MAAPIPADLIKKSLEFSRRFATEPGFPQKFRQEELRELRAHYRGWDLRKILSVLALTSTRYRYAARLPIGRYEDNDIGNNNFLRLSFLCQEFWK